MTTDTEWWQDDLDRAAEAAAGTYRTCGTRAGWAVHIKQRAAARAAGRPVEPVCGPCRAANAAYIANWRHPRKSTPSTEGPSMNATAQLAAEQREAARFTEDTARHELAVLHDEGLYRHLRFKAPGTSIGWFDLVTWPGTLTIKGDMGTYVFSREQDMFGFFRASRVINPSYWSEKTPGGRRSCKEYSEDLCRQLIREHLEEAEAEWPGVTAAWAEHAGDGIWNGYDLSFEEPARQALGDFAFTLPAGAREDADGTRTFRFYETWEWDLTDWTVHYLWCCHAIHWGIAQYDQRKAQA